MSHLTVIPTLLNDLQVLERALISQGFTVRRPDHIVDFDGKPNFVDISAEANDGKLLAWVRGTDGNLELVIDLFKFSSKKSSNNSLDKILKSYAAIKALEAAKDITSVSLVKVIS